MVAIGGAETPPTQPTPVGAQAAAMPATAIRLQLVGSLDAQQVGASASEIAAFSPALRRLLVVNGTHGLDLVDLAAPASPRTLRGVALQGQASVAVHGDLMAATSTPTAKDAPGEVVFMTMDGQERARVRVGCGPDMLTFTPDGLRVLVANEGEPDDERGLDPEGSISVIDLSSGVEHATVRTAGFGEFEAARAALSARGAHLPVPGRTLAQQFEPEYIAVAPDGRSALVTIQEASAVAVLDIAQCRVTSVIPLGLKDFSTSGLDASDRDDGIAIRPWPVLGLRQPDSIVAWMHDGALHFAIAEEGEQRNTPAFNERRRAAQLTLDPALEARLRAMHPDPLSPAALGRLQVSAAACDTDGDGDADRLVAFGGRGVSVWRMNSDRSDAALVWCSGSLVERTLEARAPDLFNADSTASPSRDARSDSKGSEPEGLATLEVQGRRVLALGLERAGGVLLLDASDPASPRVLDYAQRWTPGCAEHAAKVADLGPEGLLAIPGSTSPDGTPLIVVCNEVSGTTTVWRLAAEATKEQPRSQAR